MLQLLVCNCRFLFCSSFCCWICYSVLMVVLLLLHCCCHCCMQRLWFFLVSQRFPCKWQRKSEYKYWVGCKLTLLLRYEKCFITIFQSLCSKHINSNVYMHTKTHTYIVRIQWAEPHSCIIIILQSLRLSRRTIPLTHTRCTLIHWQHQRLVCRVNDQLLLSELFCCLLKIKAFPPACLLRFLSSPFCCIIFYFMRQWFSLLLLSFIFEFYLLNSFIHSLALCLIAVNPVTPLTADCG